MSQLSNFDATIITRLEKFRNLLGLSKTQMGKSIGLSPQRYMNITNGSNTLTTMHLQQLAEVYEDLNIRWLLSGKGEMLMSDLDSELDKKILQLEAKVEVLKEVLEKRDRKED